MSRRRCQGGRVSGIHRSHRLWSHRPLTTAAGYAKTVPLELRNDVSKNKKANESFSSAAPLGREKMSHSPVCDSIFLGLSGQNFADMSSRPTKILKTSAFRDFLSPSQSAKKGAKNLVKTRFLRRISIESNPSLPIGVRGSALLSSGRAMGAGTACWWTIGGSEPKCAATG